MSAASAPPAAGEPQLGVLEWFRVGEHERAERVVDDLRGLGVRHLRTGVSWADCHTAAGSGWYDWLIPKLAESFTLLPCFTYVPPSLSLSGSTAGPPRETKAYADFLDVMLTRHGRHFEHVELWNEPNNLADWDWRHDPGWERFALMIVQAAHWVRRRGRKTVLGGMCPTDANWLRHLARTGTLHDIDVIGLHGFPGTWEFPETGWPGWRAQAEVVRDVLDRGGLEADVWITETGYSGWRHDGTGQLDRLCDALEAPVDRVYWYAAEDLHPDVASQEGHHVDERHYHFGLRTHDGRPKLLHRALASGGVPEVRRLRALTRTPPRRTGGAAPVVVTGGAGFLGCNIADRLAGEGRDVVVVDTLARPGVERNLAWLRERHPARVRVEPVDVRDPYLLRSVVRGAGAVIHLAAQVAVTTSLDDPAEDFQINAAGTLNLLEALRALPEPPPLVFASTNKVYGDLGDVPVTAFEDRYLPEDAGLRARGVDETRPLDFHSPYGCSKGVADQYVLDYARSFGLPTTVLRMSCVYGPRQFGTEDQGWVAHFLLAALRDAPITVYGDGRQVRDLLFVDDAVDAYLACLADVDRTRGRAFNLGGGPANAVSLLMVLRRIEQVLGRPVRRDFGPTRPGDQPYYVSDTAAFGRAVGWRAGVAWGDGLERLLRWCVEHAAAPDGAAEPRRASA